MEPDRNDQDFAATLRALRPAPSPEFAARLDARAAAGFPRDRSSWRRRPAALTDRARTVPPRRILAPAGATALAAIIAATVIVATSEDGSAPRGVSDETRYASPAQGIDEAGGRLRGTSAKSTSASGADGVQFSEVAPTIGDATAPRSGPYASLAGRRRIERSAQIVLGAKPSEVRDAAAKVFDAVHDVDGIVLRSSISAGEAGEAGASFELLIPSGKLGDALASFSSIAEVRSRHESTQDITAATIGVGERLQDSRARIESLLGQLAEAGTEPERAAVEAKLRAERRRAAALRSRLSSLRRRANFSRVSLRIETGAPAATDEGHAGWGVSDGIDGAGRILAVAAGVAVIAFAILAPLALLALLAWLAHRTLVRRGRTRALG